MKSMHSVLFADSRVNVMALALLDLTVLCTRNSLASLSFESQILKQIKQRLPVEVFCNLHFSRC